MNKGKVDVLLGLQWGDEGRRSMMSWRVSRAAPMPAIRWSLRGRSMSFAAFLPVFSKEGKLTS